MNKIFEYKKKSDNFYNLCIYPIFLFPLMGIFYLGGLEIGIWIKIIGGILLTLISIGLYKNTPFSYDRIIVTNKNLIVQGKTQKHIIRIGDIESFSSNSKFLITRKSGKKVEINYSYWSMGIKKIKELNEAIKKAIETNTADTNI